jgi:4,5-DOPA dioxygenase extradiol
VNDVGEPETIHDFYGFPQELYDMRYPAHGSSDLANHTLSLLKKAKIECDVDRRRGLDHGAWVPLMVMFPDADVPIVQLSIQHHLDPAQHYSLGKAIATLRREGILVIGSGGAVHPLGYIQLRGPDAPTDKWAKDFDDWLTSAVEHGDRDSLTDYRAVAPYPERAHPRPDHYMPLLAAFGAAGQGAKGKIIHHSWYWGDLGMAAYEFR